MSLHCFNLFMRLLKCWTVYSYYGYQVKTCYFIEVADVFNMAFFFSPLPFIMLRRSPPGFFHEQLQSSGAWRDIRGVCEENQSSWNFHGLRQGTNRTDPCQSNSSHYRAGREITHTVWGVGCGAEKKCCSLRRWEHEHVERRPALWICRRGVKAGPKRRRLKWGKWMWCIYRTSAQWLFDVPASSLPLPTTI